MTPSPLRTDPTPGSQRATRFRRSAGRHEVVVVDGAWACFEAGDLLRCDAVVADTCIGVAATNDVIVLAQTSMAGAVARLADDLPIPVLSSPGPAVDAASRC